MDKQGGIMQINKQIEVTGMVCGGCEDVIEAAISKIEGVVEVKADYPSSQCTVTSICLLICIIPPCLSIAHNPTRACRPF
jgi:copper chaperone CopZ